MLFAVSGAVMMMAGGCGESLVAPEPARSVASVEAEPPRQIDGDRGAWTIQVGKLPQVPARPADDFVNSIGINIHTGYFDTPYGSGWASVVKPKLLALGVRHVRDAGTVLGDDDWMRTVYGRMKELSDRGIKFTLILRPREGDSDYTSAGHFDRLMTFAGPVVEAFEGLNEHDLTGRPGWLSEVRAFQKALYGRVKGDPRTATMPVYGPSMGNPYLAPPVGDLSAWMDFGSIHPYAGGKPPLANLADHTTRLQSVNRTRAVAATEAGYHTAMASGSDHPAVTERAMARYIPRTLLDFYQSGVTRTFLYELLDQGGDLSEPEGNFGLIRRDGTEKPAYWALKNLIGLLADPGPSFVPGKLSYALVGDTANIKRMLLAKRDGRHYLVVWQETSSYDLASRKDVQVKDRVLTVRISPSAGELRLFSPLDGVQPVRQALQVSSLSFAVSDSPLVIEIRP